MSSTQFTHDMTRALKAAEMLMAVVNCGASIDCRVLAEEMLDEYFALVEEAIFWTERNSLDRRS